MYLNKFFVMLAIVALCGCAGQTGTRFDGDQVSEIRKGVTTEVKVREMFGEPSTVNFDEEGNKILMFVWGRSKMSMANYIPVVGGWLGTMDNKSQILTVYLDSDGVVERYNYTENKTDEKSTLESTINSVTENDK